jgi:hypothetical protein
MFVWATAPTLASAGTFPVSACADAPAAANNSFVPFNSDPAHLSVGQSCPPQARGSNRQEQETGFYATDRLLAGSNAVDGARAGWTFAAAPGTTITGLQDERYIGAHGDNSWSPFISADSTTLETCTFTYPADHCEVGGPLGSGNERFGPVAINSASSVSIGVTCTASIGCGTGGTMHEAWAALYGATVTLSESASPTISPPTGALWGPGPANGFHAGAESVTFNASDPSGISGAQLLVDGSAVASMAGTCDYTRAIPCAGLAQTFTLDTTRLADGTHMLTLQAENAASNVTQLMHGIVVDNTVPAAPVGLSATAASDGTYTLTWSDPPGHAAPIVSSSYQFCPATGPCNTPETGPDGRISGLHAPPGARTVRVWLIDATGQSNPGNAATALLPMSEQKEGGPPPPELRLHHRLRGHLLVLTATVPNGVRGPITFSYMALRGRHRLGHARHRARVSHGRASATFVLSHAALAAQVLSISASAADASAVAALIRLIHRRHSLRKSR